jgi:hypothetical protein
MSFSLTTKQFDNKWKTVTRRLGWKALKRGQVVMGVVKGMGLKKGEKVQRLHCFEVKSVRRERLDKITKEDVWREGFPGMTPANFVRMFCSHNGCKPSTKVTRIEFIHL